MDVYTVIFTCEESGEAESIPWQLTFADLDLAKSHVLEEAAVALRDFIGDEEAIESSSKWEDREDYSTFTQSYVGGIADTWLIVRTELVEAPPSGQMSAM